jgi:protoporphyrinogen oxidase
MSKTHVAILGGGPAGVGAAWQLAKRGTPVTLLEQRDDVGGNAGSFELEGLAVDYGSHRLHPSCDAAILHDLRQLMKGDLLDRPRKGRIRLRGRWIQFPLKPQDMALHLPFSFGTGIARDALVKLVQKRNGRNGNHTFKSVLESGLGATICRDFYFPYAEKVWGLPPEELSAIQAERRVSAGSLGKMARKAIGLVPGLKAPGAGRFFYPRGGYGQISRALAAAASDSGAQIHLGSTVKAIRLGDLHTVEVEHNGVKQELQAKHVWSTLPLTLLARMVNPAAPPEVLQATGQISYRAMILIYVVLDSPQWTPFDAHYFPEADIKLTRLSEPKNYSGGEGPANRTILCGELPCNVGDETWQASDDDLTQIVFESLARCGLEIPARVVRTVTKRLPFAYPIYRRGYEEYFGKLDQWAAGLDRVLTFGRQGLFAHDNTHHALAMAYGAVDCLRSNGDFDLERWSSYRADFARHVVED